MALAINTRTFVSSTTLLMTEDNFVGQKEDTVVITS
jgi:hypothetical protein